MIDNTELVVQAVESMYASDLFTEEELIGWENRIAIGTTMLKPIRQTTTVQITSPKLKRRPCRFPRSRQRKHQHDDAEPRHNGETQCTTLSEKTLIHSLY